MSTDRQDVFEVEAERISDEARYSDNCYQLHPATSPLVDAILLLARQVNELGRQASYGR